MQFSFSISRIGDMEVGIDDLVYTDFASLYLFRHFRSITFLLL